MVGAKDIHRLGQTKFLSIAARNNLTVDASNRETNLIIPTIGFQTIDRNLGH
jgi:hypothetical protein